MKRYISTFATLTMVLFALSCKKVLDVDPTDRISDEVIWTSKANAETFIYGTYGSGIMSPFTTGAGTDVWTSDILASDGTAGGAQPVFLETLTNRDDYGFNNWAQVRRCNLIIKNVAASTGISDADKKSLIAEGKFLRAMSYFHVARRTGRIVWIDKPLTETDDLKLPTVKTPYESYAYIIKDLEDAVTDLPTTKIAGRANKYVAAAFLAEAYLQALAYKNYPAAPNVDPNDPMLQKAIDNAQLVIAGGYAMEPDYEGMFNETKGATSNEIIYAVYAKALNTTVQGTTMQTALPNLTVDKVNTFQGSPLFNKAVPFECWPEQFPSQNLADDYLVKDKADPTKALPWTQTSQYMASVDESVNMRVPFTRMGFPQDKVPAAGTEVPIKQGRIKPGSTETIWTLTNEGRDARWKASIISDSTRFANELFTTCLRGNATRWISDYGGIWGAGHSNLYWRKGIYTNVSPSYLNTVRTDYHWVCMRLGRVYLNLAEAYLLKGDLTNALASLNKTRTVHGQLPASAAPDLATAWTDYKRERRVELTMENDRYYSLLRWGRYGGLANNGNQPGGTIIELTEALKVMDVSKDRKSFAIETGPFSNQYNVRQFNSNRRYLFPIAQSFIDNNPNFAPQNPNW